MSLITRFTLRLLAALLVLAGILLLQKPVFGQSPAAAASQPAAPTRFSVVIQGPAAGAAPDIILIPGLAGSREDFAAEAKLLAPACRLHLIQIAGFSGEPAGPNATGPFLAPIVEELHAYIAANKLHPAIIGHSLGGLLALMLAQAHPADAAKLLMVDTLPFYGLVFDPNATVESIAPQARITADTLRNMPPEQFAATSAIAAAALVADPAGRKIVQASSLSSDRNVYLNAILEDLSTDLRPLLPAIKTPATILYPYAAFQGPEPTVTALYTTAYAAMPNAKLVEIKDSRHFIMFDQPAAFHAAVLDFLK